MQSVPITTNVVSLKTTQARYTRYNIIQLMTFDEVNTRIDQPMEHDIHRGIRVDQSLYSPKLKVINCFII